MSWPKHMIRSGCAISTKHIFPCNASRVGGGWCAHSKAPVRSCSKLCSLARSTRVANKSFFLFSTKSDARRWLLIFFYNNRANFKHEKTAPSAEWIETINFEMNSINGRASIRQWSFVSWGSSRWSTMSKAMNIVFTWSSSSRNERSVWLMDCC